MNLKKYWNYMTRVFVCLVILIIIFNKKKQILLTLKKVKKTLKEKY